jgi:hypothetical protein
VSIGTTLPRSNGQSFRHDAGATSTGGDALDRFAEERKLDPARLRSWGVEARGERLSIPYHDADGTRKFLRIRNAPGESPRFRQPGKTPLMPYGLERLGEARLSAKLYLDEGESDTWTFWTVGLPALGMPGADSVKSLEAEHLCGIETLYVCQDADEAGEKFVSGVKRRLAEIGFAGAMYVLLMPEGFKDVSDLYRAEPDEFLATLADMESEAPLMRIETAPRPNAVGADPPAKKEIPASTSRAATPSR